MVRRRYKAARSSKKYLGVLATAGLTPPQDTLLTMLRPFVLCSSVLLATTLAYSPCGIQGPDYPAPSGLAGDPVFQNIIEGITQSLDNATEQSNAMMTPLKSNETSYSVLIFDANSTLLSYHHTADAPSLAPESVPEVTGKTIVRVPFSGLRTNTFRTDETVYRLGSVSKLLFLYTFLVEVGHAHWHRPITDFIPELAEAAESCSAELDPLTCPDWHEITLGSLASHLAGLGRGGPFAPAPTAIGGIPVTDLGLPPQPLVEIKQCEGQSCTRAEELRAFLQEAPLEAAFSVPIYSNGGYQILAYALEAITNRTMSDMIFNDVFCPLEMGDSSYELKNGTAAVVPGSVTSSGWNMPLGDAGPAGGMYSSPRDMVKLGQSILSNTQLSPAATRRWLKPWAPTAVWQQAIGLAWEIAKWPVTGRVVDVYTKQGDLGMLMSAFSMAGTR
jgi:CubicO group peptidase (beta-lactamase class C family)